MTWHIFFYKLVFFFSWEKSKRILLNRIRLEYTIQITTHTSMSTDKTVFLTKTWANLFPSRQTWLNLQDRRDATKLLQSSITWPNKVPHGPHLLAIFRAIISLEQSPSISTSNKLSSLANNITRWATMASTSSTDWTRGILWLNAAIIFP